MNDRDTVERRRDLPRSQGDLEPNTGDEVSEVRRHVEHLLRVGDGAITQALTIDSRTFLDGSRQLGGQ